MGLRFFSVYAPNGRPDMVPWIFTTNIRNDYTFYIANGGNVFRDFTLLHSLAVLIFTPDTQRRQGCIPHPEPAIFFS